MFRKISLFVVVAALALICTGCGATLIVKHSPLTPSSQHLGAVVLEVNNARDKAHGGDNEMLIGKERNLYGMPFKREAQNNVIQAIEALYKDALTSAGYEVVETANTKVVVDINTFFMDGYLGYKIASEFDVQVLSGKNLAFQHKISQTKKFSYTSVSALYAACDQLMDLIAAKAVATFKSAEFQAAVN